MSTWDGNNFYFSGQGVVLIGERDALTGKPKGLRSVGNVTDLSINIAVETLEHKESQTGQRSIDLRLTTETTVEVTATLENFVAENLKLALRGDTTEVDGAAVVAEDVLFYAGKVTPLANIKIAATPTFVLESGATTLTLFVDDDTPYDYKLNSEAGSVLFNDGSVTPQDNLPTEGPTITALVPGVTTVVTMAAVPAFAEVGAKASPGNITWTVDPTNGQTGERAYTILSFTLTTVTLDWDTTGGTYGAGGDIMFDGFGFTADYTFTTYNKVDSLTQGSTERYLRFEGLNTADDFRPVVVEVFKFVTDPAAAFSLISDEVQQFELTGNALADALQEGSKFFKVSLVR
jgi:hypothetical protein